MKKLNYILLLVIAVYGCGGDNLTGPSAGSAAKLVTDGWALYEMGEYDSALSKFNSAVKLNPGYVEVYSALGWTNFTLHNIPQAILQFNTGINKDPKILDLLVGNSFALYEGKNYSIENGSLKWALEAVELDSAKFDMDGTDYRFSHNSKVSAKELRKIMAFSYFNLGNFENSYDQLNNYLNGFTLDPLSESFHSDLLKELDRIWND